MMLRLFGFSALIHAYIGWRLLPDMPLAALAATAAWLAVSAVLIPVSFARRRSERQPFADRLAWAGLLAIGAFSSLLVLTVLRDVVLLVAWVASHGLITAATLAQIRDASAIAVPAFAGVATLVGLFNARRRAQVRFVDVPIVDLPAGLHGFTIAQISDIHIGPTIKRDYLSAIVAKVNRLGADMVAVTGDLVDGSVPELARHVAPLAQLESRHGTYFVTGNHEYYSGAAAWVRELRRLGMTVLLNEHRVLQRGDAALVVAGVTDFSAGHFDRAGASDPAAALAGSPPAAVRVLLAHQPRSAEAAEAAGFDLQLSGHTHGGQFLPWNFLVRLQQPFTAGLARWRRMWVYTSRGTGYWGPPKRFGAPSEITLLRLVPARPAAAATGRAAPRAAPAASGV